MTENRPLRVFLCHSSKDNSVARRLSHQWNAEGWMDVWFIEDRLLPSQNWEPEIIKGVENADVVIVLLSKNSLIEETAYPSWSFVSNILDRKPNENAFVIPLLLDNTYISTDLKVGESINYFPKNQRKSIEQNLLVSLKAHAQKLGLSLERRLPNSTPEKAMQWTPLLWKQPDGESFENDTESKSFDSPIRRKRPRLKIKIFSGINNLFVWSAAIGTLLVFFVCALMINTVVRGENSNSVTAPIISRALTLVPLPTPRLGVGSVRISPVDGMRMVYVPAGKFIMGSDDGADDEKPARSIDLDAYWIDQFEVTNEMYKICVNTGKCNPPDYSGAREWIKGEVIPFIPLVEPRIIFYADVEFGNYPVSNITWDDASAYCAWTGRRLPTEAEWEKAARGTDGRTYPWGEKIDCTKANVYAFPADKKCAYTPTRVGSYEKGISPFGVYDMAGNVMEFVSDSYDYILRSEDGAPLGPFSIDFRVLKGGAWLGPGYAARSANREMWDTNFGNFEMQLSNGFRCATSNDAIVAQASITPVPEPKIVSQVSPADGMRMIYIPAGEFVMGSNYFEEDEKPAHTVYLEAFWIDQYEVTNGMYAKCVETKQCSAPIRYLSPVPIFDSNQEIVGYQLVDGAKFFKQLANDPDLSNQPVTDIFWEQANAYCQWVGRRLPTEAEWEKAARGTDSRIYPWGENIDCNKANFFSCVGNRSRVGSYEAGRSPYGIYDMAGNAMEWVADWYTKTYYENSPDKNPLGPASGLYHVFRGGSWNSEDTENRTTNRPGYVSNLPLDFIGFRCASSELLK